jgi:hypothetical protein
MSERVKAAVRERDGHRCTQCGLTARQHRRRFGRGLEVHRSSPGSVYSLEGCVTLCRPCHYQKPKLPRGTSSFLRFIIPQDLLDVIEASAQQIGRTRTTEVVRRLKEAYQAAGLWPPSSGGKP